MKHQLRIGLDLDGVLYPFVAVVRAWLVERGYSGAEGGEANRWAFYRDWGLTDEEWHAEFVAGILAGVIFGPAELAPEAVEALAGFADAGDEVHLITARNVPGAAIEARRATFAWVASTGHPFDSVTISVDKGCVDTDVFLEDSPDTCIMLAAETDTTPFLLAQPYNVSDRDGLLVAESIAEFAASVELMRHALTEDHGGGRCERCEGWWPAELVDLGMLGVCDELAGEPLEDLGVELWPDEGDSDPGSE